MENKDLEFVVDIQGVLDSYDRFTPKEIAITSLNHHFQGHWILTPPCEFHELTSCGKSTNNWLTNHFHGIEWYEGIVDKDDIEAVLRHITRLAKRIYTRGRDKSVYLERVLCREIINVEKASPAFKDLVTRDQEICVHHALLKNKRKDFVCALTNVAKLKKYIRENMLDGEGKDVCG